MKKFRVALIIETSSGYGRAIHAGVSRFVRRRHDWSVFVAERDHRSNVPSWIYEWEGDGILSRYADARLAQAVKQRKVPLVSLVDDQESAEFPTVRSDDHMIGRMAAEYLLKLGHRRFAYCGFSHLAWSTHRQQGFMDHLAEHGRTICESFATPRFSLDDDSWDDECRKLEKWIDRLPKPIALMACSDIRGYQVTTACANVEVSVPEDIAIVGVDNDPLICELSSPGLTSVQPNAEMVGYAAAETLDRLMLGEHGAQEAQSVVKVPPMGIALRQSTDSFATNDKDVANALRFIRQNACSGVTVSQVVENGRISRSTLERRMRDAIDRTPQQQIRHVQIARVRELLSESDEPMSQIASLCGFEHAEYMHVVFKRETGVTPGEFRRAAAERRPSFG